MKQIKVCIVEDSKPMQELLANILLTDPQIEIVGKALDPFEARDIIKETNPDVITLDIIMPRMDGITFLKNLMRLHPLPVIVISALAEKNSAVALEALLLGAVGYIPKPTNTGLEDKSFAKALIQAVKEASTMNVHQMQLLKFDENKWSNLLYSTNFLRQVIIIIGASIGGIEAIEYILNQLPKTFPPILIVQHIRPEFSKALVDRLNKHSKLEVTEARDLEEIIPGKVYVAPGNTNLLVNESLDKLHCELDESGEVNIHKPSIDALFKSVSKINNKKIIALLLTGMGEDGAEGSKAIHDAGGIVIVQDKKSSVVFGMPKAAIELQAVTQVLALNNIPDALFQTLETLSRNDNK